VQALQTKNIFVFVGAVLALFFGYLCYVVFFSEIHRRLMVRGDAIFYGIYVEIITNKCEGMVSVRDMKDDHYVFDEDVYALVGYNHKKMYQLGDEVVVKVKKTDLIKRHLDFLLIGKHNNS